MQPHSSLFRTRFDPPAIFDADSDVVDLWSSWVDEEKEGVVAFEILDVDERARAGRFRFRRDRDRFIGRHAFVRRVLAGYVGIEPAKVAIRIGANGRPGLDPQLGISFNASHSDGLAVVGVAQARRVGVDIERLRQMDDLMEVAAGHLTDREIRSLRATSQMSRSAAFLTLWTRKESFVKAVGYGLSIALDSFDSSEVSHDGIGRPTHAHGDLPFAFVGLGLPDGYVGAVTLEGTRVAIRHMDAAALAA